MKHLFVNEADYEKQRCIGVHIKTGLRCKHVRIPGFETCYHHLTPQQRKEYRNTHTPQNKPRIKKISTENAEEKTLCRHFHKDGSQCQAVVMVAFDCCWVHATPTEKAKYRKMRRQKHQDFAEKKVMPQPYQKPNKRYDGYTALVEGEKVVECKDGHIYGYYGGVFPCHRTRELFRHAPVGDIDDDIRIIRFMVRDALENQMLFIQARDAGDIDTAGWIVFSKDVSSTLDEQGRTIAETTKIIKRKKDYLEEIKALERLLMTMEQTRVELKKAQEKDDDEVVPFSFNVLPPSSNHPIYGTEEPQP